MKEILCTFLMCLLKCGLEAANISGPSVYVVTPSARSLQENEGRSAPFYYHNWMRRMDPPQNSTTTTTKKPKVMTPDLIFAEFESENGDETRKSIRKLLEQERVTAKTSTTTTTTSKPIYVAEASNNKISHDMEYAIPSQEIKSDTKTNEVEPTDYFSLYNNYGDVKNSYVPAIPAPVYLPTTTSPRTTTTTSTTPPPSKVENIWHIIDSEKHDQYSNGWVESPVDTNSENGQGTTNDDDDVRIDENFALPGFGANPGNGGENESRAIRTEPNYRFPYVSLKPFVMKNENKHHANDITQSKKGSNMFTTLDNFKEIKYPARGEIQDVVMREPVDRYNPAQPYLPQAYGSKSKQSSPPVATKAVANLVPPPPPPPPPPKVTGDDFPAPTNYESFPPYPPAVQSPAPQPSPPVSPPVSVYKPPNVPADSFDSYSPLNDNSDSAPMDTDYSYKPPSPPVFVPTLPPLSKPSSAADSPPALDMTGYSYKQPAVTLDSPPTMTSGGYSYNKPSMTFDSPPPMPPMGMGYSYRKPEKEFPSIPDMKPNPYNAQYDKPDISDDHVAPSYGPSNDHDYPELIYDHAHAGKGGHDMKESDMGMMLPPPPPTGMQAPPGMDAGPPSDDHGFPSDFPGDLKFHHDFDDDDFHHYHHHHHTTTTTTTTTTEMPRVSRFSYYYLGKKLYYLPLYFSVYFIVYVGALIIKAVLRHKIVYPNSFRPNDTTATFFAKRSVASWDLSNENLHEVTGKVTKAIGEAAEKYLNDKAKSKLS